MKRLIGITAFFLVFLASFSYLVSAQGIGTLDECSDSQVIFKLFGTENTHGETWDGGAYPNKICYDEKFGTPYTATNPHACLPDSNEDGRPDNAVIRLSGTTNAHAEIITKTTPAYDYVCYGDLVCASRVNPCGAGEVEIAAINATTNSHLALGYDSEVYTRRICCSSASAGGTPESNCELTDAYWADENGNELPNNAEVMENVDRVRMVVIGNADCEQELVEFRIRETDDAVGGYDWDEASEVYQIQSPVGTPVLSSGMAVVFWSPIYVKDEGNGIGDDEPEYVFRANLKDDVNVIRDSNGRLKVLEGEDVPPIANITAPVHRGIYFLNTQVTFDQNPGPNPPSNLEYLWTIEHEDGRTETKTQGTFSYTFEQVGQDTITLRVRDPNTGLISEDQVAVLVVNSPGVLAYINSPRHLQLWQEISVNGRPRLLVNYSSEDSYVVNVNGPGCSAVCLAGYCPSTTQNLPPGSSCGANIPITNQNAGWANAEFAWDFGDGEARLESGADGVNQTKLFGSRSAGTITTDLVFNFNDGTFDLEKETERTFELGSCIDSGTKWRIPDDRTGGVLRTVSTLSEDGFCTGFDGNSGTLDDCCPSGLICGDPGDGTLRCYDNPNDDNINYCQDYTDYWNGEGTSQNACEEDLANVAENDPQYDTNPECGTYHNGRIVECGCVWRNDECSFKKAFVGPGGQDEGEDTFCTYDYVFGECVGGYKSVQITATWSVPGQTDPSCVSETSVVLCGSPSIELDFYGKNQLIASIMAIFVIYSILFYFNHKRKK